MKICPKCQMQFPNEVKFCGNCGAALTPIPPPIPPPEIRPTPKPPARPKSKAPIIAVVIAIVVIVIVASAFFVLTRQRGGTQPSGWQPGPAVVVTNKPPVADFGWAPTNPTTEVTVNFVCRSYDPDGSITTRSWYFGDGTYLVNVYVTTVTHKYTAPGSYYVRLIVKDNKGATDEMVKMIVVTAPEGGDTTAPTISNVQASSITSSSATISWMTNEPATSQVEYCTATACWQTPEDTSLVTSHSVNLTGLSSSTTYTYKVKSKDVSGNLAVSANYTFTTSPSGVTSVTISITYYKDDGTKDADGSKLDPQFEIGVDWEKDGWYTVHTSQVYYNTSEIYNPHSIVCYVSNDVSSGYVQICVYDKGQDRTYGIDINSSSGETDYKLEYFIGTTVNIHSNGEEDGEFPGPGGYDAEIRFTVTSSESSLSSQSETIANRVVLAELCTATWCGYCPYATDALNQLANEYGSTKLAVLEYHPSGSDPFGNADSDGRINYYGVTGYPTCFFDGVEEVVGGYSGVYNDYKAKIDYRLNISTPMSISVSGSLGTTTGTVNAYLCAVESVTQTNLKVRFVIYEDNISYNAPNGETNHRFVVRDVLPDETLTISQGQCKNVSRTFTIQSSWDKDNLGVVVFVQSDTTKEVLQACTYKFI